MNKSNNCFQLLQLSLLAILLGFQSTTLCAEIYKWTDENGRVHFTDKQNLQQIQETVTLPAKPSKWQKFKIEINAMATELSQAERETIENDVNNVYHFFDRVVYFDMYKTVPVKIALLHNEQAYIDYLEKVTGSKPTPSRGMFVIDRNEIVVYMRNDRNGTLNTIKHETSHAILHTLSPFTPSWLNEGVAELMETLVTENERLVIYPHAENLETVNRYHNQGALPSIEQFLDLRSDHWRESLHSHSPQLQSMAGEFCYFLTSSSSDRRFLLELLQSYRRGIDLRSLYLVEQNYLGGLNSLRLKWNSWLLNTKRQPIRL